MKVAICGHWQASRAVDVYQRMGIAGQSLDGDGCAEQRSAEHSLTSASTTIEAHQALCRGITHLMSDAEVQLIPFGAGADFAATCALSDDSSLALAVPTEASAAWDLGESVSALVEAGEKVMLEGGHYADASLWMAFCEGAAGVPRQTIAPAGAFDVAACEAVLRGIGERWGGRAPSLWYSTRRPLVGLASVMAVLPDLSLRLDADTDVALKVRTLMRTLHEEFFPPVQLVGQNSSDPATAVGSGAAGGVGGVIALFGGQLHELGPALSAHIHLPERLADCDQVIVTEPLLHSPYLAEATLDAVTFAAGQNAIPVVAVGVESSLSRHELAQWGLHGSYLSANTSEALEYVGQRIAHTWLRRLRRVQRSA